MWRVEWIERSKNRDVKGLLRGGEDGGDFGGGRDREYKWAGVIVKRTSVTRFFFLKLGSSRSCWVEGGGVVRRYR